MAKLPQQIDWDMASNRWASMIEPFLNNPTLNTVLLPNIPLTTGANTINHRLGRPLKGWYITRIRNAPATFYDTQDSNPIPTRTLTLNSSADVIVDIVVF